MKEKRMLRRIAALALCLTMAAHGFGWLSPAYAANANASGAIYTFGNPDGPFRDLAKEHEEEVKQREKERKKAEKERKKAEKAAKKKAKKRRGNVSGRTRPPRTARRKERTRHERIRKRLHLWANAQHG